MKLPVFRFLENLYKKWVKIRAANSPDVVHSKLKLLLIFPKSIYVNFVTDFKTLAGLLVVF